MQAAICFYSYRQIIQVCSSLGQSCDPSTGEALAALLATQLIIVSPKA